MDLNSVGASELVDPLNEDYCNDFVEIQTIYEPHYECPITTSVFDPRQELFWTGNSEGRVTSYYGISLSKYTSFRMPPSQNVLSDIKMLHPHANNDLFVLTSEAFSGFSNFGVNNFIHKEVSFQNLQIMELNHHDRFFLGGFSNFIYDFDFERLRILRQLSIADEQSDCILIKCGTNSRNGFVCTGSSNGQIFIRDPLSLKYSHRFHPHSGSLSDIDVHENVLVTSGFSLTRSGPCVDRFIMAYDLRMMRALNPVQLIIEPCFLHFLPMCSSVVAVGSQAGCFQLIDINSMTPSAFYQAQVPPVGGLATTFSMSSNSQVFAFGHSSGSIHLFTKGENVLFNDYSEPTLIVEQPQYNNINFIDLNHELAPLSSVPVPLPTTEPNQKLISDLSLSTPSVITPATTKDEINVNKKLITPKYRPTLPLTQELLDNSRIIHGIISVPNRIGLKRNQTFNESYEAYLKQLEENSKKTSIELSQMGEEMNATSNGEEKNETNGNTNGEHVELSADIKEGKENGINEAYSH